MSVGFVGLCYNYITERILQHYPDHIGLQSTGVRFLFSNEIHGCEADRILVFGLLADEGIVIRSGHVDQEVQQAVVKLHAFKLNGDSLYIFKILGSSR